MFTNFKCPHCAEEIQKEAKVCKHCHRDIPQAVSSADKGSCSIGCLIITIGLVFFGAIMLALISAFRDEARSQPSTDDDDPAPLSEFQKQKIERDNLKK